MNNLASLGRAELSMSKLRAMIENEKGGSKEVTENIIQSFESSCKGLVYHLNTDLMSPEEELLSRVKVLKEHNDAALYHLVIKALSEHRIGYYLIKNEQDILWNPLVCDFIEFERKSVSICAGLKVDRQISSHDLLKLWGATNG